MKTLLEVQGLTKKFKDFLAVNEVSFAAHAGEIFGLLGPNGAGKTTTIRTIATVLAPTSGTATICGVDVCTHPEEAKRHLGMLTTDIGVYERFSGRENLHYFGTLYGLHEDRIAQRTEELIHLLDMGAFIDKRAGKYSTGMKQKLAIARAVIHDPDVLIFDEPTSGLDVLASQTVLAFMKQARELGKCVVLSTHQMPDAERLCDRVAIMHQGSIVAVDTVAAVKQQTGTSNLEDAFLKLVAGSPARQEESAPTTTKRPLPRWWWRVGVLVLAGLAVAVNEWQALNPVNALKVPLIVAAIALGVYGNFLQRRRMHR